jgi:gluconate 5-dehydrogenase
MNKTLDLFSLKGKVAIVTGGYGHLGTAFSKTLQELGAIVYVAARSKEKFQVKFENENDVHFLPFDILSSDSIKKGIETVYKERGHIDVFVNNAFHIAGQFPEETTDAELVESFDGTIGSVYKCIRELMPYMKIQKSGNIINIASMYGIVAPDFKLYEGECHDFFNSPQYGAGKAAVVQLTKYFAEYLAPYGIRVNAIAPGTYPSGEAKESSVFVERLAAHNPMGRIGVPEDLKGTMAYLATEASRYTTGQTIQVDGGWTIW